MADYDAELENETYDLDSLGWIAHPQATKPWETRGWYTAITFLDEDTPKAACDLAVDFSSAVLHDIWMM